MEKRDQILASNPPFFDNKPVILKKWDANLDITRDEVRTIITWVKLKLDFKYWGESCIFKIAGQLGKPIKLDQAIVERERLQFARLMVEVKVDQMFHDEIEFINEHDVTINVPAEYEWKPIFCFECKGMGHKDQVCKNKNGQQVWRAKPMVVQAEQRQHHQGRKLFQPVIAPTRRRLVSSNPLEV